MLHLCYRPLTRTLGITVKWLIGWSFHPQQKARTALSSRPSQESSSQPWCFETCAGRTSHFRLLPPMIMVKDSAAVLKWWWVLWLLQCLRCEYISNHVEYSVTVAQMFSPHNHSNSLTCTLMTYYTYYTLNHFTCHSMVSFHGTSLICEMGFTKLPWKQPF